MNKHVKRELRRELAEQLGTQFTSYSQLIDRLIHREMIHWPAYRRAYWHRLIQLIEAPLRYGYWVAQCEAVLGKITIETSLNRAEAWLCASAIQAGMAAFERARAAKFMRRN